MSIAIHELFVASLPLQLLTYVLFRCKAQTTMNDEISVVHSTPLDCLVERGFLFERCDVGLNRAKMYDGLSSDPLTVWELDST